MNATICEKCGKIAPAPSADVYTSAFTLIIDGSTVAEDRKDLCAQCREDTINKINDILKYAVPFRESAAK